MMPVLTEAEFTKRYPHGSYDGYVAGEKAAQRYYSRPAHEVSRDLAALAAENRAAGRSND